MDVILFFLGAVLGMLTGDLVVRAVQSDMWRRMVAAWRRWRGPHPRTISANRVATWQARALAARADVMAPRHLGVTPAPGSPDVGRHRAGSRARWEDCGARPAPAHRRTGVAA